jgi:hypothetical protein
VTECDSAPLVPVTPTWTVDAAVKVQDRVALPEPVTLVGATEHEVLLVVKLTTPANPFSPVTVILEVPADPAFTVTLEGLAAIVKSWTTKVTVTEWDRLALVPVTPTCTVEAAANVQDRVALPEPVTLVGETEQEVLLVVKPTTPAKPFRAVTVMLEVPAVPALTVTLSGLAAIVKSWTTKVTVTLWDRLPLVPVTPTWTVDAAENVQDKVALPEPVTLVGATEQEVLLVVRLTTPAKPFWPVTVILEVPAEPAFTVTLNGLAAIVKSWTTNVTVTEWDREPLVPVTPTWTVETAANVQDSVALPEPVTLVGATEHEVLFVVRLTTPAKPFRAVIVILEVPAAPTFTLTLVGVAMIVKSCTMYVTVTEWDRLPLVPVTPTWTVEAAAKVHDNVALPEPVTLVGATEHEVLLVVRLTAPANPLIAAIVIVEVPAVLALTVTDVGLAAIVKSWTTNVTVTEWERAPLVPVTDTCLLPVVLNVQDRVALPDPVTLVGATEHEVLLVARPTTPAKPFRPVTVILEVPAALTFTLTLNGLAAIVKSWTT